ncbi:MAG: YncE family protein [Thaumarchaeota archaeon]|nr:YncE family protein [Nitrososphaerota archaeon]
MGYNNYDFLIFTQKGIAELASTQGSVLGYTRLFNLSDSIPTQTFYWEGYPTPGAPQSNFLIPLNNGTIIEVNASTMAVSGRISVGSATGFIGVAISPDEKFAAVADGPSGIVEVINLKTLQTVWSVTFDRQSGATAFPCDIRWSPDESTIVIPMKNNGTVDVLNAQDGVIISSVALPIATQPFMLTVNSQGTMLAVELSGNKTDAFFSYPSLKSLGTTSFSVSTFSPTRGVFTPDGNYYLEASGATNVVEVISTSTFTVVNTINLPASASPGLADMEITPDGDSAYVVMHGTPTTGGIIYMISLSTVTTATGPTGSIALTTAPAYAIPISIAFATFLADNVLSPPVTGLHC